MANFSYLFDELFMNKFYLFICFIATIPSLSYSQISFTKYGQFYGSWGYNKEWYKPSTIEISQPELNCNYKLVNTPVIDKILTPNEVLKSPLTIPQYNYRLGYFFDEEQRWAFEINFDHTKCQVLHGKQGRIVGTFFGRKIDSTFILSPTNLKWQLNNGANFLLFNIVRKFKLVNILNRNFQIDCLVKGGIGPVIPHVENTIFGNANEPHFQLGGWNTGVEQTFRILFFKSVYLELCHKVDYARYSRLRIYKGLAKQELLTYELIANLGFCINRKRVD